MITLTDKLAVTADSECYMVGRPAQRRGKGVELRSPRYYSTLAQAVRAAVSATLRQKVAENEITTLQEFIRQEEQLQEDFSKKLEVLDT